MSQSSAPALRCKRNRTQSLANNMKKVIGDRTHAMMDVTLPLLSGSTLFRAGHEAMTSSGGCGPPGILVRVKLKEKSHSQPAFSPWAEALNISPKCLYCAHDDRIWFGQGRPAATEIATRPEFNEKAPIEF